VIWGVRDLTVDFGATRALSAVTLAVPPGQVTAVVGGDGAGKSTLLRVMAGLPVPYRGEVRRPESRRTGYVPTTSGTFADLTVKENLDFMADAYKMRRAASLTGSLLELTGLAPFQRRLARDLSGGMRHKLGLLMAMLHEPDLLVLDEPTTGIDPASRSDLWRLIARAVSQGAAALLSSVYLDEAERAASVLVLHEGRPLVSGSPDQVVGSLPGAVIETDAPTDRSRAWRRGTRWREWLPEAESTAGVAPTLEDVVIVAELSAGGRP
jgi:ABC-2 type transport system ATP-binding protein